MLHNRHFISHFGYAWFYITTTLKSFTGEHSTCHNHFTALCFYLIDRF